MQRNPGLPKAKALGFGAGCGPSYMGREPYKSSWGYIGVILWLYRGYIWVILGYIGVVLGLYWGYIRVTLGFYWGYIGVP